MQQLSNRTYEIILVGVSLIYTACIGIQGFDIADEGWSMTGFQQIFKAPESVEYLFLYYLVNVVGGIWEWLFGWGGIYAYRILTGIFMTASSLVVWRMLRPYFSPWSIILGLWAVFFCSSYGIMAFYHNYLMDFLAMCAAAALMRALLQHSSRWMALSGFLIGCNVFVRLPNITLTALILLLIPYYLFHRDARRTYKLFGAAVGGFAIGIACVVALMIALGHFSIFVNAIDNIISAGSDSESNHNVAIMLRNYLSTYKTVFLFGYFNNLYSIYLFGTLSWLVVICSQRSSHDMVYLTTISLIIMHVLPLGSDWGIGNTGDNCIHLAVPLLTGLTWKAITSCQGSNKTRIALQGFAVLVLGLFFLRGAKSIYLACYYDVGPRSEKTYRINHPLATTFTTKENSEALSPVLHKLSEYVRKDDYLLCFQNAPTIHYLTHTRPYLYNPWPWCDDSSNMERQFQRAEANIKVLPVIVRDKMMIFNWSEYDPDWNNNHAENTYFHKNKKIKLINQFIQRHDYHVVWENKVFQILIPAQPYRQ